MSCGQVFLKAAHAFRFRAAALAAWVCSLHQTLDWPPSRSAIALVLAVRPYRFFRIKAFYFYPSICQVAFHD